MSPSTAERLLFWTGTAILTIVSYRAFASWSGTYPAAVLFLFLAAWMITLVGHEAGHVLAARLVGFRLLEVGLAPLRIWWDGDSFRLSRSRHNRLGGYFVSLPVDGHRLRRRFVVALTGGPAANLVIGVGAYVLFLLTSSRSLDLSFLFYAIAILSLVYFPANLLPFRRDGSEFMSDGQQILRYLRGGPWVERRCALARLEAADRALGELPEAWNPGWIDAALTLRDGSEEELRALVFAYFHAIETGDVDGANWHLRRASEILAASPQSSWRALYAVRASFEAYYRHDVASARLWQARAGKALSPLAQHELTAVIALTEGNGPAARAAVEDCLRELPRMVRAQGRLGRHRAVERWLRRLEAESAQLAPPAETTA